MITPDTADRVNKRDAILDRIFVHETDNSLQSLLKLLNGKDSEFSSLWFCGSRIDHMRCLGSEEIGWGVSALPSDYDKAKMPKYHPYQVEIMIPIHGLVTVETYTPEQGLKETVIKQGTRDNIVIENNMCHRIKQPTEGYRDSAFFYVKTNVGQQPQDIGVKNNDDLASACEDCQHHPDRRECPIFQSYFNALD